MSASGDPVPLPMLGLGTWQMDDRQAADVVARAIGLGYRLIDTATGYENEEGVGAGIRAGGVDRAELTVTTKFPEELAGFEREVLSRSLKLLRVDFLDLWLIHGPVSEQVNASIWQRFIDAREDGLVRAIGVSNFSAEQVEALARDSGVVPAVNQIAFGPRHYSSSVALRHAESGVRLQGHSPFSENDLSETVLKEIAARHDRTVTDIILRWHREHGVPVVAKAATPAHLRSNLDAFGFSLPPSDRAAIDGLGRPDGPRA